MNIGVLSDSHGDCESLRALTGKMGRVDAVCFLGDVSEDARYLEALFEQRSEHPAFYAVRGNNDPYGPEPEEITLTLAGHRMLMVHGHRQGVKQGLTRLSLYARQKNADIVLFGHTHMPCALRDGDMLFVNPGAAGRGFFASKPPCAAVLCVEENKEVSIRQISCE